MGNPPIAPLRLCSWNLGNFRAMDDTEKLNNLVFAIRRDLASPHIIAVQEMMGDGEENPSSKENASLLLSALNELDPKHPYAYCDVAPKNRADGGKPGDNIRCGFLYRTDRVSLMGEPTRIGEESEVFKGSRKPCVAHFRDTQTDEHYHLINVHFSAPIVPLSQKPIENIEAKNIARDAQRINQAKLTAEHAKSLLGTDSHVVVCGDFNNKGNEELKPFQDIGLIHANASIETHQCSCFGPDANGKLQGLNIDHLFVSETLHQRIGNITRTMLNDGATKTPISDHNPTTISVSPLLRAAEKSSPPPPPFGG